MTRMIRLGFLGLLVAALAMCGCDRNSGSGGPPPPGAKPGHLTGKLSDARGGPLSNVTVSVFGFSDKGEPVTREVKLKGPATEYDIPLPDGKYNTPIARIGVDYNGRWYDLPLAAVDGAREWAEQKEPARGMVRDFVWRISRRAPSGVADRSLRYLGRTRPVYTTGYLGCSS